MVIKVPIAITYNNKGTKAATRDIKGLEKTLKRFGLASKLSLAAATTGLTVFAKKSVMAAAADDKAQKSLARSLKNLGLAYSSVNVEKFVKDTSLATGVADDQLRPAFQRLVTATGSVTKSQELLNLALNVSAGTGKSLESVTTALTRAYLGNTTSLGRLGAGLTKAELKKASFEKLTAKLSLLFAGQATEAAESYAGKIDRLKIAASEASEVIGTELLNSVERLTGDGGVGDAADQMTRFGDSTANVIAGVTTVIEKLKPLAKIVGALNIDLAKVGNIAGTGKFNKGILPILNDVGKASRETPMRPNARAIERESLIAQEKAAKLAKAAAAAKAKELATQRAITMSKKLAAKFDQDMIAIEAALKGDLSEEDRKRLLALKALKTEVKTDDEKALAELEALQKKNAGAELARIKEIEAANTAANQKRKSELTALQEWLASNPLNAYINVITPGGSAGMLPSSFGAPTSNAQSRPPATNAPSGGVSSSLQYGTYGSSGDININVDAGIISDENRIVYLIADAVTRYTRFGGTTTPAGFI
jgi:hypothetical protein